MTSSRSESLLDNYQNLVISKPIVGGMKRRWNKLERSSTNLIRSDESADKLFSLTSTLLRLKSQPLAAVTLQSSKQKQPLTASKVQLSKQHQPLPASKVLDRQTEPNKIKEFLKRPKTMRKEKRDGVFTRFKKLDESVVEMNLNTMEGAIHIAQAIYPGMLQGHEHCTNQPIVMPKTIKWLRSNKTSSGVPINWRPGAIPKNVAIIMEKSRSGYYKALREEDAAKKKLAQNMI